MKRLGAGLLLAATLVAAPVQATVTFEYVLTGGYPTAVSNDGQTIVGNIQSTYGAFRWTQAGGFVALGQDPTPSPGGAPGVSADGLEVAATIVGQDSSTYSTAGLWTQGVGWHQLMPPGPVDLADIDRTNSDAYGLSGDGSTVVGLYWKTNGRGHAFSWRQATGGVDLGSMLQGHSSRANGVNADGSVVVGWDEAAQGNWRAAAWYNGVEALLTDTTGDGQATRSNPDGTIIVGYDNNSATGTREVTRWTRTGSTWSAASHLGAVPGTIAGYGENYPLGITKDGATIVGYCTFDGSPYNTTGFVWTPSTGTIDVVNWLGNNGVAVDPGFYIESVTCMTPDGQWIVGYGQDLVSPHTLRGFRIHNTAVNGVAPSLPPAGLALAPPSPNPTSGPAMLSFSLPYAGEADLAIFDAAGRRVASPLRAALSAGPHAVEWDGRADDGRPLAAGLYFARLVTAQGAISRRLVRLR